MATIEERLAQLEGKVLPVQRMRADLYEDYLRMRVRLRDSEEKLIGARPDEVEAHKKFKFARESYNKEESAMLATDERAGGPNDTVRKRNAENLIHQERAKDGKLHDVWIDMMRAQHEYEMATAHKENCLSTFSADRHIFRIIAGLAQALGA